MPLGRRQIGQDAADGILKLADRLNAGRHGLYGAGSERQSIEECGARPGDLCFGHILRVGSQDRRRVSARMDFAMAASARFFWAAPASASWRAAARASRPMVPMAAWRFPALRIALSGAFMALIRLAIRAFSNMFERPPARRPGAGQLSTVTHSIRTPVTDYPEHCGTGVGFRDDRNLEGVMGLSMDRQPRALPKRLPAGTVYVVEGRGGDRGNLRVSSRYVVMPSGQKVKFPVELAGTSIRSQPRAVVWMSPPPRFPNQTIIGGNKKICSRHRNKASRATLSVKRRAKPPSPSPSISRRRTPAVFAAGVLLF